MKKRRIFAAILLVLCLCLTGAVGFSIVDTASAKEITSESQAKKLAKKEVKGARVVEVEREHDDGILEYEVKLIKGKKEYDLKYRAADAKLISYTWEIESAYIAKGKGAMISKKKCKKIARKKVPGGKVLSVFRKRSDGIDLYEVKMRANGKRYELEIHARSGKVLEYDWELISKQYTANTKTASAASKKTQQPAKPQVTTQVSKNPVQPQVTTQPQQPDQQIISLQEAKQIALSDAELSEAEVTFTKAVQDYDDGILEYEIEFYTVEYEYDYEVNARTGAILKKEVEKRPAAPGGSSVNPGVSDEIISAEQANQIALAQVPGASLIKSEFDIDDGISVYEVELLLDDFEYEIKINAATRAVIEVEKESIYD